MNQVKALLQMRRAFRAMARASFLASEQFRRFGYLAKGQPPPPIRPFPRGIGGMTARQYRAARRKYAREMTAWHKNGART